MVALGSGRLTTLEEYFAKEIISSSYPGGEIKF